MQNSKIVAGQHEANVAEPGEAITDFSDLALRIHQILPQTQCQRCGYPDCAGYAGAIAQGRASINQCAPGGKRGIERIAQAMERSNMEKGLDIDPAYGAEGSMTVAVIDESWCIGCTLCMGVCPTDAIVGSHKRMHTVLPAYCTGCELCLPVCPVDCISMKEAVECNGEQPFSTWSSGWSQQQADVALQRYTLHQWRIQRMANEEESQSQWGSADASISKPLPKNGYGDTPAIDKNSKRALIETVLARARSGQKK